MNKDDKEYVKLINQNLKLYKRVQELENLCEQIIGEEWMSDEGLYESEMMKLSKENKNYGKALQVIQDLIIAKADDEKTTLFRIDNITRKTLSGDSDE